MQIVRKDTGEAVSVDGVESIAKRTHIHTASGSRVLSISADDLAASPRYDLVSLCAKHAGIVRIVEDAKLVNDCAYAVVVGLSEWAVEGIGDLLFAFVAVECVPREAAQTGAC